MPVSRTTGTAPSGSGRSHGVYVINKSHTQDVSDDISVDTVSRSRRQNLPMFMNFIKHGIINYTDRSDPLGGGAAQID
jgi:hypothetical protein